MADKIPLKANFTGADVTSLGEFAASDTVPVANGGTGAATAAGALTNLGAAALAGSASQSFSMLNGTVAGGLGVGTAYGSQSGGRKVQVVGPVATYGSARWWYAGGSTTADEFTIGLRASTDTVDIDAIKISTGGAVTIPGTLSLTGAASTLGYGVGAGGTVTQATSKSTSVTLNKPCGQITMNAEALAAGAIATFQVNNSLVGSYSTAIVNAFNNTNYRVEPLFVVGTAFGVKVTNITGGSLSEALVLNFAIFNGAIS